MRLRLFENSLKKNPPKRGFLAGAAAQSMREFLHEKYARNLSNAGMELADLSKLRIPAFNAPGAGQSTDQAGFLWDTFVLAPATQIPPVITMFSTPQNQATKSLAQTNLRSSQNLGAQQMLVATGMRLYLLNNATPTDILALFINTSVQLFQGPQNYPTWQGMPWMIPAGGGLWLQGNQIGTAPTGSSVLFSASNGTPTIQDTYTFTDGLGTPVPVTIAALEDFSVALQTWSNPLWTTQANTTNPPGTGLTGVVAFEGIRTQQVTLG